MKTNVRSLKSEFYQSLKYLTDRKLGVKLTDRDNIRVKAAKLSAGKARICV